MVRPSRAQIRVLQFLLEHELRRVPGEAHWRGDRGLVARLTIHKLENRQLVRIVTEAKVKRCLITELGRRCVQRFGGAAEVA